MRLQSRIERRTNVPQSYEIGHNFTKADTNARDGHTLSKKDQLISDHIKCEFAKIENIARKMNDFVSGKTKKGGTYFLSNVSFFLSKKSIATPGTPRPDKSVQHDKETVPDKNDWTPNEELYVAIGREYFASCGDGRLGHQRSPGNFFEFNSVGWLAVS